MSNSALPPHDQEMTLVQHLLDLRNAVAKAVIAVLVLFLVLFPFANDLYVYIAEPLTRFMPEGASMIAVGVASPFLTPFKLSLILAIYLAMPYLLYQFWTFIAPALYKHERQLVAPILFFSSFLFYAGGAFAYYVVFPLVFGFLSQTAPEGVTIATDISLYLDFVIKMFFAFGLSFEVPVVVVLLILTGMVKPKSMSHARPYVIVGAFVLGMLLTPPDIISQTLLAVPVWLLYELGILVGALILKRKGLDKEPSETSADSHSAQRSKMDEEGFDDRYADQVNDDFDYDAEFDKIDAEMSALNKEQQKRQQNEQTKDSENPNQPKGDDKP
ncbi:MAG: twin-arginine translocase subunit TatC [Thiomicrospira sp.]|uniref:twin-arginine translocase subunit TatC n=1 Tax=Thiomicrospira sp. TaxID=935 RepID=UPI0019EE1B14|nr:twin-arginine translocase subunit TatC [Thiomicrospira sp.]MBE0493047.1 twin-arginine translocase subunit TatC [Thiomicrospira sp.]